jgi:hypothetical protein
MSLGSGLRSAAAAMRRHAISAPSRKAASSASSERPSVASLRPSSRKNASVSTVGSPVRKIWVTKVTSAFSVLSRIVRVCPASAAQRYSGMSL